MGEDVTHRDITVDISDDENNSSKKGFPEAVKEIGDGLFRNYEDKTAYLSSENILGTIRCDVLNDFMEGAYGIRFSVLDKIVSSVKSRRQSKDGYGKDKLIEALQKLQASFDLIEGDSNRNAPRRRF